MEDRPDSSLGGTAEAHHFQVRDFICDIVGQRDGYPVARQESEPQGKRGDIRSRIKVVRKHLHLLGDRIPYRYLAFNNYVAPARRIIK